MKLLLDTHVFLWYITDDARLPDHIRTAMRDPRNELHLSSVSVWEALVKHQIGKLVLPSPPSYYLRIKRAQHGMVGLSLTEAAVSRLPELPLHHRDPFDRMLICQALEHSMTVATIDLRFASYDVPLL